MSLGLRLRSSLLPLALAACGDLDPRAAEVASVLARADEAVARARPTLVAGKYEHMAASLHDFYRGVFPLFVHDLRAHHPALRALTAVSADAHASSMLPLALGDAHLENLGTLLGADGAMAFEANDFDAADRWPFTYDLARLAGSCALASRLSGAEDLAPGTSDEVIRALASGYVEGLAHSTDAPRQPIGADGGGPVLADLFERAEGDEERRDELAELTVVTAAGQRVLARGVLDPSEPSAELREVPLWVRAALPPLLEAYRGSLASPPPASHVAIKDVVRELGSGVASYARVRLLVLVEGPTVGIEDDLVLELKELTDSATGGMAPPWVYADSPGERVMAASRAAWSRPLAEPWWGASVLAGLPCQVRRESEGHKSVRVARLVGELAEPAALAALASASGRVVGRMHGSNALGAAHVQAALSSELGSGDALGLALAEVGRLYADQVEADHQHFRRALEVLGPTLGVQASAEVPPHLRALFEGVP